MASESLKTKAFMGERLTRYLRGEGIDIGCGNAPILPNVTPFDLTHGDANYVSRYVDRQYDFVFSSHCLEHLYDPRLSLADWYQIIKPGGYLIVLVPDEDLYEQGHFPSVFNGDHKWTFTISKSTSWSPKSINLLQLALSLGGQIIQLELQDHGYNRRLLSHRASSLNLKLSHRFVKATNWLQPEGRPTPLSRILCRLGAIFSLAPDQTALNDQRLAQICLVVRKPEGT